MHFSQAALLLSSILSIDASPIPRGSIARDSGDFSGLSSFYAAAFEKRRTLGSLRSEKRVNNATTSAELQARSAHQGLVFVDRRDKNESKAAELETRKALHEFTLNRNDLGDILAPIPDKLKDGIKDALNNQKGKKKQSRGTFEKVAAESQYDAGNIQNTKRQDGDSTPEPNQESGGLTGAINDFGNKIKSLFGNFKTRDVLMNRGAANSTTRFNETQGDKPSPGSGSDEEIKQKRFVIIPIEGENPVVLEDPEEDQPIFDDLVFPSASDELTRREETLGAEFLLPQEPESEDEKPADDISIGETIASPGKPIRITAEKLNKRQLLPTICTIDDLVDGLLPTACNRIKCLEFDGLGNGATCFNAK
ncbi:hypothetical protein GLAREA_08835 [Glarea lozoyensis ATCC 20868]|uniref:Uncharacterized protein n=1 Tax=Glarea lozoyensis (strain ATCC 20868 / MF5171) TaxID=1116229 RepID=S3DE22_GLAL2|nr:uncharacterized protein GLAREA_08835 [Glarea lozoyensis ATCC 20868]EPE36672.1 hypothetical protein GLAREA_08835 [Glarea lozoyensis ATCC 20868]